MIWVSIQDKKISSSEIYRFKDANGSKEEGSDDKILVFSTLSFCKKKFRGSKPLAY